MDNIITRFVKYTATWQKVLPGPIFWFVQVIIYILVLILLFVVRVIEAMVLSAKRLSGF